MVKQIPSVISKRLFDISIDKEQFDKAPPVYNEVLKNSGLNETLKFLPTIATKWHRGRNIIWFNLPFNSNAKTNVGKLFSKLTSITNYLINITWKPAIAVCLTWKVLSKFITLIFYLDTPRSCRCCQNQNAY